MQKISAEIVEKTWKEPEGWSDEKLEEENSKLLAEQPELYSYIMYFVSEYDIDVQEVGLWIFFMVYRMYRTMYGKPIPRISEKEIISKAKETEERFESLKDDPGELLDEIEETQAIGQPEIWRYITEALMEDSSEEDVELEEEAIGELTVMYKTVVELLDEAVEKVSATGN